MLEERLHVLELFDLYGALLTEKQQECVRMYLADDFSLAEIGECIGISRQAAYDNIHRAEKALEEYESKLGFGERSRERRESLQQLGTLVRKLETPDERLKNEIFERILALEQGAGGNRY